MSEYQYYEFRKMEQPLTAQERKEVASISSRAEVSSYKASFVYHYGDFHGDEKSLMETHFDMMLYVANWGSKRLMFRIPASLLSLEEIAPFCLSSEIDAWLSKDKKYTILDLDFNNEDGYGEWIEGEGMIDELTDLRDELMSGDLRLLYLASLEASELALDNNEIDEETLEPPVPKGLKELTDAQKAYIDFLEIDDGVVAVASENSEDLQKRDIDVKQWISKISEEKKDEFLLRLSQRENNLSTIFNHYIEEMATQKESNQSQKKIERRTISSILIGAEDWNKRKI